MKILMNFVNTKEEVKVKHIVLINKETKDKLVLAFKNNTSKYSRRYNDCEITLDGLDIENSILPSKDLVKSFEDNDEACNYLNSCYVQDIVLDSRHNEELSISYFHIQVNGIFTNNVLYKDKVKITNTGVPVYSTATDDNKIFVICSDRNVYTNNLPSIDEPKPEPRTSRRKKAKHRLLGALCSKVKDTCSNAISYIKDNIKTHTDNHAYKGYSSETLFLSRMALINR